MEGLPEVVPQEYPDGQSVHEVDPAFEYFPVGQGSCSAGLEQN